MYIQGGKPKIALSLYNRQQSQVQFLVPHPVLIIEHNKSEGPTHHRCYWSLLTPPTICHTAAVMTLLALLICCVSLIETPPTHRQHHPHYNQQQVLIMICSKHFGGISIFSYPRNL